MNHMNPSEPSNPNTNLKLHFVLIGVAVINIVYGVWFISVPLLAWVLARWVIMGVAALKDSAAARAIGDWNGRYFAYDDRQIRIYWDDRSTWVVAEDVFRAIDRLPDEKTRQRIAVRLGAASFCTPESIGKACFSRQGVRDYLAGLDGEGPMRLGRWFEREVFANLDRLQAR